MKKVILKCELKNRDNFEAKLKDIELEFSPVVWQHDRVYLPRGYKRGMNYPRLTMRTEMHSVDETPKYSLILKRHIEDSGIDIVEETPVTDYEGTVNIILQLGFRSVSEISRRRRALDIGDGTMIYLDSIDGIDKDYAKIETPLMDNDSVAAAREDLLKTFSILDESKIIEDTYFEIK